jgi:hypothetical protein
MRNRGQIQGLDRWTGELRGASLGCNSSTSSPSRPRPRQAGREMSLSTTTWDTELDRTLDILTTSDTTALDRGVID